MDKQRVETYTFMRGPNGDIVRVEIEPNANPWETLFIETMKIIQKNS